jgi:putative addiction module antidote
MKLKVTTVGNSAGVVLPKDLLARLGLEKGDELFVTEIPGGIKLQTYDPEFERQMAAAERIMRKRRNLLHQLAAN